MHFQKNAKIRIKGNANTPAKIKSSGSTPKIVKFFIFYAANMPRKALDIVLVKQNCNAFPKIKPSVSAKV